MAVKTYIFPLVYFSPKRVCSTMFFPFSDVWFFGLLSLYIKKMANTLPAFAGDVRVWFAQLELYFVANNVTKQRQLHILFSAFPASLTPVAKDLITNTPLNSTYDSIKREVLLRTSLSAEKRFQTLVNDELLGDRLPSELLRRIRALADIPADSALIKQVEAILAPMAEKSSVDVIASAADKLMDKGPITALFPSHRLKSLRFLLRLGTQAKRLYFTLWSGLPKK